MSEIAILYSLLAFSFFLILLPVISIWRKKGDIFEPVFITSLTFFMYFWFRSVYALIWGTPFLGQPPFNPNTIEIWNIAWLYLILSFVLFLLGYYSKVGILLSNITPSFPTGWSSVRVYKVIFIVFLIGLGSFVFLVRMFGDFSYFLANKVETYIARGTGPFFLLCLCIPFSAECMYIVYLISHRRRALFIVLVLFILTLGSGFAIGIKGGGIIFPFFSTLVIYHYLKQNLRIRHLILFVSLIIIVFPIFIVHRATTDLSMVLPLARQRYTEPILLLDVFVGRFMGFDPFLYAIQYTPAIMDYQYGKTMLDMFLGWIPQRLWTNKPVLAFGQVFAQRYLDIGSTVGPTILGEAYINFHIVGIMLVSFLSGILFRFMYYHLIKRNRSLSGVFVYATILPYLAAFWEYHFAAIPAVVIIFVGTIVISVALSEPKMQNYGLAGLKR